MKKVWSERHLWHSLLANFGVLSALVGGFVLFGFGLYGMTQGWTVMGPFLISVGILSIVAGAYVLPNVNLNRRATWDRGNTFAVVDKITKDIIAYGYDAVYLKPYPFSTRYEIRSYPAVLRFACPFQPITKNPKMVPLFISISTDFEGALERDPAAWIYISNADTQKFAEKTFRREAFELIQHKLPQDLGGKLNPYDPDSLQELKEFVASRLDSRLPYGHRVRDVSISIQS